MNVEYASTKIVGEEKFARSLVAAIATTAMLEPSIKDPI
jgi:hypothetical protein